MAATITTKTSTGLLITLRRIAGQSGETLYEVLLGGVAIGNVAKFKDTRHETHPWRARVYLRGLDHAFGYRNQRHAGCFYPADGGRAAAIDCILVERDRAMDAGEVDG